jgi:RIO-like serine/threonine protein kinase
MALTWLVSRRDLPDAIVQQLETLEGCFAMSGQRLVRDPKSSVLRFEQDGVVLYIKKYVRSGKFLRKYIGRSRVRAEWENLHVFDALGIPTPPLVAWGEERHAFRFVRGALVTAEVPYAINLLDLFHARSPWIFEREKFRLLAAQIADYTRRLHEAGFAHGDLNWRNILVSQDPALTVPQVYFFDSPAGRYWSWPFLEHRITKDLALLEKVARRGLSLRWRLWFYHQYTGRKKMTAADKRRLRRIAGCFPQD